MYDVNMVGSIESELHEIARQLRLKNRLEAFRLRKEYSSSENDSAIDAIMEGNEP